MGDYTGIDVSSTVIAANKEKYEKTNASGSSITFKVGSATESLPGADLLIIKDVLQHLPFCDVVHVINANFYTSINAYQPKFKYILYTNDVKDGVANEDIERPGLYRVLDITKPPFNVAGLKEVYRFPAPSVQRTYLYEPIAHAPLICQHPCQDTWHDKLVHSWHTTPHKACQGWSTDSKWGALKDGQSLQDACQTDWAKINCAATCGCPPQH